MSLPDAFLARPIAHRALHDVTDGRPENSREAVTAALDHGYGIEIDVQLSRDGQAMVFHDYVLDRLTAHSGPVRQCSAAELGDIHLSGAATGIPTLAETLALVRGQVPLLIEIKDQDGAMGPDVGPLERAVVASLVEYEGPVAIMSFNPHSAGLIRDLAPDLPRGLVTSAYTAEDWPTIPSEVRERLREIPDYDNVGASFISHELADLARDRVAQLKERGAAVLCWTVKSPADEAMARQVAQNITFERYLA